VELLLQKGIVANSRNHYW